MTTNSERIKARRGFNWRYDRVDARDYDIDVLIGEIRSSITVFWRALQQNRREMRDGALPEWRMKMSREWAASYKNQLYAALTLRARGLGREESGPTRIRMDHVLEEIAAEREGRVAKPALTAPSGILLEVLR